MLKNLRTAGEKGKEVISESFTPNQIALRLMKTYKLWSVARCRIQMLFENL